MATAVPSSPQSQSSVAKKTKSDFEFLKEIGEGSFSTVYLAKDKSSQNLFAIKECNKVQIVRENKVKYVHLEKKILAEYLNNHPFFVKLCFTFQDEDSLYFGLSYCPKGDLLELIRKNKTFSIEKAKFYSAELTEALEFMHGKMIIHRDLKPENILLDENFHIKLTDFGTARILEDAEEQKKKESTSAGAEGARPVRRKNSFVGTAQFVSPEILQSKPPTTASDLWSFGCIIFQMLTGNHLFSGNHEYDIFQKIVKSSYTLPENFDDLAADLIKKLVVVDSTQRLGAQGTYHQLKAHPFFADIVWSELSKQSPPV